MTSIFEVDCPLASVFESPDSPSIAALPSVPSRIQSAPTCSFSVSGSITLSAANSFVRTLPSPEVIVDSSIFFPSLTRSEASVSFSFFFSVSFSVSFSVAFSVSVCGACVSGADVSVCGACVSGADVSVCGACVSGADVSVCGACVSGADVSVCGACVSGAGVSACVCICVSACVCASSASVVTPHCCNSIAAVRTEAASFLNLLFILFSPFCFWFFPFCLYMYDNAIKTVQQSAKDKEDTCRRADARQRYLTQDFTL